MRKISKLLTLSGILLLTILFLPNVYAQEDEIFPEYEQEFSWTIPAYAPAKVNINYIYTHNHSIKDISCLGATSLYRHSGGPENMLFEAEDIDIYRYTIELNYKEITQQHLTVGIWSGTIQAQPVFEYNFYTMHTVIHVILQVAKEPMYPTAEETAEATWILVRETFVNYTRSLEQTIMTQNQILTVHTVAFIAFGVISIGSAIAAIRMYRKIKQ